VQSLEPTAFPGYAPTNGVGWNQAGNRPGIPDKHAHVLLLFALESGCEYEATGSRRFHSPQSRRERQAGPNRSAGGLHGYPVSLFDIGTEIVPSRPFSPKTPFLKWQSDMWHRWAIPVATAPSITIGKPPSALKPDCPLRSATIQRDRLLSTPFRDSL